MIVPVHPSIYIWAVLLQSTEVAQHLNPTTNCLEMQEYLLASVNRALSAFKNDKVISFAL